MVSYRCVGYGTTNSSGVATLDHNLDGTSISGGHSYTGSGVGELDFVASVDSPTQINNGSDVSETFVLMDCRLYDEGTSARYNDTMWGNWNNSATIERKAEYTSIKKASDNTQASWQIPNTPFSNDELTIEFDVYVDVTGDLGSDVGTFIQVRNQAYNVLGNIGLTNMQLSPNQWHHIIIAFKSDGTVLVSNTTNSNTSNRNNVNCDKVILRCETYVNETRYKNFKVY